MKGNFERALAIVLRHEGGFVNHPNDPGGTTDRYVTKNTYTPFGEPATPGDTSWRTFVLLSSIGTILDVTPKTGWSSYPGGKLLPDDIQWGPYDNVSPEKPTIG